MTLNAWPNAQGFHACLFKSCFENSNTLFVLAMIELAMIYGISSFSLYFRETN